MDLGALIQTAMQAVPSDVKATVEFTRTTQTYNPSTNRTTVEKTSVFGTASEGARDPKVYETLSLITTDAPSLVFVPDVVGEIPALGDEVVWGGVTYTVKDVKPIAPRGLAVAAVVVISA